MKTGSYFVSVVPLTVRAVGQWEPQRFASAGSAEPPLSEYLAASKPKGRRGAQASRWAAIEYRHIPPGESLAFTLEERTGPITSSVTPRVGGGSLLLGTMRAYLANVVVTPEPSWVGFDREAEYEVKAEFLHIRPTDGHVYFWWAFFHAPEFLSKLPLGGGGTRPRLSAEDLLSMRVPVPSIERRSQLDKQLRAIAEAEWRLAIDRSSILASMRRTGQLVIALD